MTGKEVRDMRDEQIKSEVARLRTRLLDLRSQTVTEKVENNAEFRSARRDVARLLTERRARQIKAAGGAAGGASGTKK